MIAPEQSDRDYDKGDREKQQRHRRDALHDEMRGAGMRGAEAADATYFCFVLRQPRHAHRAPPNARKPTTQSTIVNPIEPTKVASVSISRSAGSNPRPISQIRWRRPPSP